jgi:hypothetical protein
VCVLGGGRNAVGGGAILVWLTGPRFCTLIKTVLFLFVCFQVLINTFTSYNYYGYSYHVTCKQDAKSYEECTYIQQRCYTITKVMCHNAIDKGMLVFYVQVSSHLLILSMR